MTTPHWLGPIRQSAFVVSDIEAAATEWVETQGVGPWFLYQVEIPDTNYRGQTVPMRARMGLAQSGGQQVELIQPDPDVASIYNEYLDSGGTGLHHVCYWADIERAVSHFETVGCSLVQRGQTGNGNEFAYLTGTAGVPYVELVDPNGAMAGFFAAIADAAVDWDGSDPLR